MDQKELKELSRRGIALLRFSSSEWEAIEETRNHGTRFSGSRYAPDRDGVRDLIIRLLSQHTPVDKFADPDDRRPA